MSTLPSGTITFLFTDIEGSTRLWETQTEAMRLALARHDELLRAAIEGHRGSVFKTVGDAFCAAFDTALDGLEASLEAQLALAAEPWGVRGGIRVRMGLHTGTAEIRDNDYFGQTLNRAARLQGIGHGGQLLVSLVTEELLRDHLPDDVTLKDIGEHRLKDLMHPERVFQVAHPGLGTEFPPVKSLDARPHNLPVQPTPFLGREKELAALAALLERNDVRVITLLGPGGTGKTRLALQVAADASERFEDGVWFFDLSSVDTPAYLFPVLVRTLGLRESEETKPLDLLRDFTAHRSLLFVLDNFEQIRGGHPYVVQLLTACPSVKVVVTSREALKVRGEQVYPVAPLAAPRVRAARSLGPSQLGAFEAVSLFIDRSRAVRPDFAVTTANAPVLAEICARLDGLPLAIELAASRVALLEPEAILERLSHQLRFLTGGLADLPPRQRTLRAAIDGSYRLLSVPERTLLQDLSVFAGATVLEAVEAVCGAPDDAPLVDVLTSLADKSLVARGPGGRFRLLESIREYAGEERERSGGSQAVRDKHAAYYLAEAEALRPQLRGSGRKAALDRYEASFDDQVAALDWWCTQGRRTDEARLASTLGPFWRARGHLSAGLEHLGRPLDAGSVAPPWVGSAWVQRGLLQLEQGDPERAEASLRRGLKDVGGNPTDWVAGTLGLVQAYGRLNRDADEARCLAAAQQRAAGDPTLSLHVDLGEGASAWRHGDVARAEAAFRRVLDQAKNLGDPWARATAEGNLGLVSDARGDRAHAIESFRRAAEAARDLGDVDLELLATNNLAYSLSTLGRWPEAQEAYYRGLTAALRYGYRHWAGLALCGLSDCQRHQGRAAEAVEFGERAVRYSTGAGDVAQGVALRAFGEALLAAGRCDEADEALRRALPTLARSRLKDEEEAVDVALRQVEQRKGERQ